MASLPPAPCVGKGRAAVAHEIGPRMGDCAGQARAAATIALRHDHAIPHKWGRGAAKAQRLFYIWTAIEKAFDSMIHDSLMTSGVVDMWNR